MDNILRSIVTIPCEGDCLLGTIDGPPDARIGWLFVIGGSQTRVGPHRLYERLAFRLAEAGHAVLRFDRRGIGDSEGEDPGYLDSAPDITAASRALSDHFPLLEQNLAFGLCDGASAIALHGDRLPLTGAVLANPWVVEPQQGLPPAAAIRGHYRRRILDPRAWLRLLSGGVNFRKLARGIAHSGRREDDSLVRRFAAGLPPRSRIVLADGDGTAQAFAAAWKDLTAGDRPAADILHIPTASHSFADPAAFEALVETLLGAVTPPR
jgi:exosortase A-associated hydrolase 1